jgi:hypothetical protein
MIAASPLVAGAGFAVRSDAKSPIFLIQGGVLGLRGSFVGSALGALFAKLFEGMTSNPDGTPRFVGEGDAAGLGWPRPYACAKISKWTGRSSPKPGSANGEPDLPGSNVLRRPRAPGAHSSCSCWRRLCSCASGLAQRAIPPSDRS